MRTLVVVGVVLLAAFFTAGCVGNFGSEDPTPATTTHEPGTTPASFSAPPPQAFLKTSIKPLTDLPPWVEPGTKLDVEAALPADGTAPYTWTWGVAPLLGTAPITQKAVGLDTGSKTANDYLAPGASKSLTFSIAGVYQMHCHPHYQFMRANVTVIDGLSGPKNYDVYIEDGSSYGDFKFVPENITIPTGSVVTYHNAGSQAHTSSLSSQDAPLVIQPLATNKGTITLTGNGWSRVVAIVHDAKGRIGQAEWNIYIAPYPANYHHAFYANLTTGAPTAADAAPTSVAAFDAKSFKLDYNGTVYVNVTFLDPASASGQLPAAPPASPCTGEFHLREQGATQDTITGPEGNPSKGTGRAMYVTYNLVTTLRQGVNCEAIESIDVVYDHLPAAPLPYIDPESLPHTH